MAKKNYMAKNEICLNYDFSSKMKSQFLIVALVKKIKPQFIAAVSRGYFEQKFYM